MKLCKILLFLLLALAAGCGGGGGGGGGNPGNTIFPTLVSITLAPIDPSVATGTLLQFTAMGTYSDNSTQNLTTSATWSSSATSAATISNAAGTNGLATAVTAGTTTITATSGLVSSSTTMTVSGGAAVFNNVLPLSVNGSLCSASSSYPNKPCVSVTVCAPGTSTCQTISDILLDTGSYGLRIFNQALTVLPPATGALAECIQFGDGMSVWGSVQTASVILGNEPAIQVPIQVIDTTFGTTNLPAGCRNADSNPAAAGFTGILGIGLFTHDCGTTCANSANNGIYFNCNGTSCRGTTVPLAGQVQNPVALLPQDNNGVIVQIPSVPAGGIPSVSGSLVLGIGTKSNNTPSSVTAYSANQSAQFSTRFNGRTYSSFLDTGSNGILFTPPVPSPLPICSGSAWFCPASPVDLSATNTAASGSPAGVVTFRIGNYTSLTSNAANNVFAEIGGTFPVGFDWGLPFFFGKSVYVGFEGKTSATLGTGPYWAY